MADASYNTIIDISSQQRLGCSFAQMRQDHIDSIGNQTIDMRIIERSLELIDISNVKKTIKKKIKLKINTDEQAFLRLDTLDPLNMSDDELEENFILTGCYRKISYTQVRDSINTLYYDTSEYYSSAMDILASYVRGQKLIYMESKYHNTKQSYIK